MHAEDREGKLVKSHQTAPNAHADASEPEKVEVTRVDEEDVQTPHQQHQKDQFEGKASSVDPRAHNSFVEIIISFFAKSDDGLIKKESSMDWILILQDENSRLIPICIVDTTSRIGSSALEDVKDLPWERQWIFEVQCNGLSEKEKCCFYLCGLTTKSWEQRCSTAPDNDHPMPEELTEISAYAAVKRNADSKFRIVCPRRHIYGVSHVSWRWDALAMEANHKMLVAREEMLVKELIALGQKLQDCSEQEIADNGFRSELKFADISTAFDIMSDFEVVASSVLLDGGSASEAESENLAASNQSEDAVVVAGLCITLNANTNGSVISDGAMICVRRIHDTFSQKGAISTFGGSVSPHAFLQRIESYLPGLHTTQPSVILLYVAGRFLMEDHALTFLGGGLEYEREMDSSSVNSAASSHPNLQDVWTLLKGLDAYTTEWGPRQWAVICHEYLEESSDKWASSRTLIDILLDEDDGICVPGQPFVEGIRFLQESLDCSRFKKMVYIALEGIPDDFCVIQKIFQTERSQLDETVPSLSTVSELPQSFGIPFYLLQEHEVLLPRLLSARAENEEEKFDAFSYLERIILESNLGNVVICGPLGIGKRSLLVKVIASVHTRLNVSIFWIDASTASIMQLHFMDLCDLLRLGQEEEDQQRKPQYHQTLFLSWLNARKGWIIVLENLFDLDFCNQFSSESGLVIAIIARDYDDSLLHVDESPSYRILELTPLSETEAITLLPSQCGDDELQRRALVSGLANFPLSLKFAKFLVGSQELDCAMLLKVLDTCDEAPSISYVPRGLVSLVRLHIDDLQKVCPAAVKTLMMSSFLSSSNIQISIIRQNQDSSEFDEAIRCLLARSFFITVSQDFLYMHKALQAVLREIARKEDENCLEVTSHLINAEIQGFEIGLPQTWPEKRVAVEHGLVLFLHGCRHAPLLKALSLYLSAVIGDFEMSLELRRIMLDLQQHSVGGRFHSDVAVILSGIGSVFFAMHQFKESLNSYEEALEIQEHLSAENRNQADLASAFANVGVVLDQLNRKDEALVRLGQALDLQMMAQSKRDVATTLSNMAIIHRSMGQDKDAMDKYEQALLILEDIQSNETEDNNKTNLSVSIAKTLNNIANIHSDMGHLQEAILHYRKSLSIKKDVYGQKHWDVAITLDNMGILFYKLGEYSQAVQFHEEAFMIREQEYGYEDVSLADTLINLGKSYSKQGQWKDAILAFQNAITIQEQYLGAESEATATTYMMVGSAYEAMNKFEEARANFEQALKIEAACPENCDFVAVNSLRGLGNVHIALEQYGSALSRFEKALEICASDNRSSGHYESGNLHPLHSIRPTQQSKPNLDWEATFLAARSAKCVKDEIIPVSDFLVSYRSQYMGPNSLCAITSSIVVEGKKIDINKQFVRDVGGDMIRLKGERISGPKGRRSSEDSAKNRVSKGEHHMTCNEGKVEQYEGENDLKSVYDGLLEICAGNASLLDVVTRVGNQNLGIVVFEMVLQHFQVERSECLVLQAGCHFVDIDSESNGDSVAIKFEGYFKLVTQDQLENEAEAEILCALATIELIAKEQTSQPIHSEDGLQNVAGHQSTNNDSATNGLESECVIDEATCIPANAKASTDESAKEADSAPLKVDGAKCCQSHLCCPSTSSDEDISGTFQYRILDTVPLRIARHQEDANLTSLPSPGGLFSLKGEKRNRILDSLDVARILSCLGLVKRKLNRHGEAVMHYEESLNMQRTELGDDHVDIAKALSNLGHVLGTLGHHNDALLRCEEALAIYRRSQSAEQSDIAFTLDMVGTVCKNLGRFEDALEKHEEALKIRRRLFGQTHIDVATTLMGMGNVYNGLGEYDDAVRCYSEALEIQKQVLGCDHTDVAKTLNNIAIVYRTLGRHDEALAHYEESLKIKQQSFGKVHIDTAKTLGNIANAYHSLGRHDEALSHYEEALEIFRIILGDENVETAKTMVNLANVYESMGRHEDALENFENALPMLQNALGSEHTIVATTLMNMGLVLSSLQRYEEALLKHMEALQVQKRLLGSQHAVVATTLLNIGGVYKMLERNHEALLSYEKCLVIQERALGRDHADVALTRYNMADVYERVGKREKARQSVSAAHSIFAGRLGDAHMYTRMTARWLRELDRERAARGAGGLDDGAPQHYNLKTFYSFPAVMIFGFLVLICLLMGDTLDRLWFGEKVL